MIKAIKDYNDMIWKGSCKWLKKHWKGYALLVFVLTVIEFCWIYRDSIQDFIGRKVSNKEDDEKEAKYKEWN